jgi:predicted DNA-binding transcriptional regulator YafY
MRADRLLSLLSLLQTRGRMTTDRLAEELEVSRRTVIRDLYALRVAGFPVNTERGPRGGCSLDDDFRNRLLSLNQAELSALFMTSIPAPLVELGVARDLKGALLKLSASLPATRGDVERRVRQRVHLDSIPWAATREPVRHLSALHRAALEDRWVRVTFERARQIRSERHIAPYGLVAKATTWYVIWAGDDGRLRVDRVSRILEADLEDRAFERPADFDLAKFWSAWCERQEANGSRFEVTACVSDAALDALRSVAAVRVDAMPANRTPTDSVRPHRVRMTFGSIEEARGDLLAFGGSVDVVEPLALRLTLADFAQQTLDVHRAPRATSA